MARKTFQSRNVVRLKHKKKAGQSAVLGWGGTKAGRGEHSGLLVKQTYEREKTPRWRTRM